VYDVLVIAVVRYKTIPTARRTLLFIVRAFFNDTITVAVWTGFHVRLLAMLPHSRDQIPRCFADPAGGTTYAKACGQSGQVSNFVQIFHSKLKKQNGSKHQGQAPSVSL
jgi:hypothetical protein